MRCTSFKLSSINNLRWLMVNLWISLLWNYVLWCVSFLNVSDMSLRISRNFPVAVVHVYEAKKKLVDFNRYQKVENSLRINLHLTAYMFNGLLVSFIRKVQKKVSVYSPPFSGLKLCDLNIFVQRLFGCLLDCVYCVIKFKEWCSLCLL